VLIGPADAGIDGSIGRGRSMRFRGLAALSTAICNSDRI